MADESNARTLEERIEKALLARHGPFQQAVTDSAHGSELFDEYSRLCRDIVLDSHARFQAMLATTLKAASRVGEIDLKTVRASAAAAAELLNLATAGLKHGAPDLATFEKRVHKFVGIFIAGLR